MADETRAGFEDAPASGRDGEDALEPRERCRTERDALTPRETADCAGADLVDAYENEEDGGS